MASFQTETEPQSSQREAEADPFIAAQKLAEPLLAEARKLVKEHPVWTIAASVGVGFLIGRILSKKD